jgi:hypothetical protein
MDADVRRAVLGIHAPIEIEPAHLPGWRRVPVAAKPFPCLVRDRDAAADGVLVRGLGQDARRRLEDYEGPDYRLLRVAVTVGRRQIAAATFVPNGRRIRPRPGVWDLGEWQRRHKRAALAAIARA